MSQVNSAGPAAGIVLPLGDSASSRPGALDPKTVGRLVAGLWIFWAALLFGVRRAERIRS